MPGTLLIFAIAIVGAGLITLGLKARSRLGEDESAKPRDRPEDEYLPQRYQPMTRLLAGDDLEFLRRNSGCPKVAARWERSRRRIIRLYLKELAIDFYRLHTKARVLVAESPEQYASLVPVLLKQQFLFRRTLLMIEVRLFLGGWKVTPASVRNLVGAIEAMQQEMARIAAASAA